MFKVSRKSEYALIAVQHLCRQPRNTLISVAELAIAQNMPPDILAKVLQGLKKIGILTATKGSGGGYRLAKHPADIRFLDVVRPFEEQIAVVACQSDAPTACDRTDNCTLREPMAVLNNFVIKQFDSLTMEAFIAPQNHGRSQNLSDSGVAANLTAMGRRAPTA